MQACSDADPQKVAALEHVRKTTDSFVLSQRIDRHLERLWALATRGQPHATRDGSTAAAGEHASAWMDGQPCGAAAGGHYGPNDDRRS